MNRSTPSRRPVPSGTRQPSRRRTALFCAAALLGIVAAGCSSDDSADAGSTTTASTAGSTVADSAEATAAASTGDYCSASLELETAGMPDIDPSTATPEEMTEAVKSYAHDLMPKAEAVVDNAPAEIEEPLGVLSDSLDQAASTGDYAAFESPEATAASATVHQYDLANCDWAQVDVVTKEYSFSGIPGSLAAGPTSFELTNEGNEAHEIAVLRKKDGVTESTEELMSLPEEEAGEKVTMVGVGGPVTGGNSSYLVADLEAGDYVAICFLPVGMTSMDGPPPDGPPHFMSGMVTDFTVS